MQDVGKISVYCHMSDAGLGECGGGGWTLAMKIDGNKVQCTLDYEQSQMVLEILHSRKIRFLLEILAAF